MYSVLVQFGNGQVETVAKGLDNIQATAKAEEAAGYYAAYINTVFVVRV